jgi:hypothetical protein
MSTTTTRKPLSGEPDAPTTTIHRELEELDQRFVGHDDDLMMRLKDVVREHITRSRHDEQE